MKLFSNDSGFYKKIFALALPIALQSLISIGVNMLDTIMVGSLGESALSATSLANSFISIYHILCMGLGMGASVLVSRYWGMKKAGEEPEKADRALKQTVSLVIRITVAIALIFALVTLFMPSRLMTMYTQDEEIIRLGKIYFDYSVVTYFFLGLSLVITIVLRSVGQVKLPLYISIGAFFVNLGANYILIFGKFGAPRMEVAGAALGTLISRLFEASVILVYLFIYDKNIRFRIKDLFMKTSTLISEYIRISIPVLISDAILAFGNNSVAMVIGHLGAAFVAANAITSVTQQLSSVMIQGVCQAGAIVTGQTLGTGDKEKTMEQGWLFLGLGFALGAVSAVFILLVSNPIIATYKNVSEETVVIARQLMVSISLIVLFQATNSIMTKGVLRGGGDTKMLMLADNVFLWILSIPLGLLAGFVLHLPAFWIYVCLKSDQIVKTFWCVIRLRSRKWIKRISTGK
ncbi:MATE family efflux transporter [Treponema sp.]|uniref:MATE family efflux transporter n=1 Tax=Treponema sp. TaxID=166 RepID=UPI00298D6790|nr:MATE family efflux transporter [Treponema sp.]MCQ2241641.1 MATE family efflux transporter [Treponema sp.]